MEHLNAQERQQANTILHNGLLKAAQSLSFFMKEDVTLLETVFSAGDTLVCPDKGQKNIHVLSTEVIGNLPGVCYFVLSEEEANCLRDRAIPEEIKSNPAMMAEMQDAILLEVDNIISAAVITAFSNVFQQKMYGNVPGLRLMDRTELQALMDYGNTDASVGLRFKGRFALEGRNFYPEFIWLFEEEFVQQIKALSAKEPVATTR